jgi:MFS superfamily sulfate permease-like transporter
LTLGNAVIAVTDENNRLFPNRPVTHRGVAVSTGLMNLGSALLGGVPMCHGAGGIVGHVQFGARTGGAPIILGTVLIVLAVLFGPSIAVLLQLFPAPVLGVILFLTGARFALGAVQISKDKGDRLATFVTAALAIWNLGIGVLVGLAVYYATSRRWIRL